MTPGAPRLDVTELLLRNFEECDAVWYNLTDSSAADPDPDSEYTIGAAFVIFERESHVTVSRHYSGDVYILLAIGKGGPTRRLDVEQGRAKRFWEAIRPKVTAVLT